MDPPYWQLAGYGGAFGLEEYEQLAATMQSMKGKAMLTINDHRDIRRVFKGIRFERAKIRYTVGGSTRAEKEASELVYRNW